MTFHMSRRHAVQLKMAQALWDRANWDEDITPDHLRALHEQGGEQWQDLLHDLISAAHPFVAEDGTWVEVVSDYDGERTVTEHITLDDVLAASHYAQQWVTDAAAGFHAAHSAANDGLNAYAAQILKEARDVLREALAAEQGLVD